MLAGEGPGPRRFLILGSSPAVCSKERAHTQGLCSLRHQTWQCDLGQIPQPFAKPLSPHQKDGAIHRSYLQVRVNSIILKGFLKRIFLLFSNPQPLSWPGSCPSPQSKPRDSGPTSHSGVSHRAGIPSASHGQPGLLFPVGRQSSTHACSFAQPTVLVHLLWATPGLGTGQ